MSTRYSSRDLLKKFPKNRILILGDLPTVGFMMFGFADKIAKMAEIKQVTINIVKGITISSLSKKGIPLTDMPEPKRAIIKDIKMELRLIIILALRSAMAVKLI